ncbi:hypothetical protein SAMD00023353_4800720 [Rosellinia necatrix]|uniref:Uncharacterized protein n=1 Tax=Rosellinia necatrix TaxID=77044 RepID=A0A1W2TQB8_ROSNE|nr:hypothetical protein SAMD00023353_4800720 [Rosellinia necatrix]
MLQSSTKLNPLSAPFYPAWDKGQPQLNQPAEPSNTAPEVQYPLYPLPQPPSYPPRNGHRRRRRRRRGHKLSEFELNKAPQQPSYANFPPRKKHWAGATNIAPLTPVLCVHGADAMGIPIIRWCTECYIPGLSK